MVYNTVGVDGKHGLALYRVHAAGQQRPRIARPCSDGLNDIHSLCALMRVHFEMFGTDGLEQMTDTETDQLDATELRLIGQFYQNDFRFVLHKGPASFDIVPPLSTWRSMARAIQPTI